MDHSANLPPREGRREDLSELKQVVKEVVTEELSAITGIYQQLWVIQEMILRLEQRLPPAPAGGSSSQASVPHPPAPARPEATLLGRATGRLFEAAAVEDLPPRQQVAVVPRPPSPEIEAPRVVPDLDPVRPRIEQQEYVGDLDGHWSATMRLLPALLCVSFAVLPPQAGATRPEQVLLRIWIIYRLIVMAGLMALALHSVMIATLDQRVRYDMLFTACMAIGTVGGLRSLVMRRWQEYLVASQRLCLKNAGFAEEWCSLSMRRFAVVSGMWLCSVVAKTLHSDECVDGSFDRNRSVLTSSVGAVFAMLIFCQLHTCSGLELAVDSFCKRLLIGEKLAHGVNEWNTLQAMLRRSAHCIEGCVVSVAMTVLGLLLLTGSEILGLGPERPSRKCSWLWAGWALPQVVLVLYTIFRLATVTEKCKRVPPLVNSRQIRGESFYECNAIVQYMRNSEAGFYICSERLSRSMAVKLLLVLAVTIFTLCHLK